MKARRGLHSGNHGQGSNWIRREKRLRIYARDGWRCVWCQAFVTDGKQLREAIAMGGGPLDRKLATLDHFLARGRGGTNDAANLLTSCIGCNEQRGDKPALVWATELACVAARTNGGYVSEVRALILERCLRSLEAPLLSLEERSAA
jgi:hypothetical protein